LTTLRLAERGNLASGDRRGCANSTKLTEVVIKTQCFSYYYNPPAARFGPAHFLRWSQETPFRILRQIYNLDGLC